MSRVLPILFSSDMVRQTLDGRRTATRRAIKYGCNDVYDAACLSGTWYETYNPQNPPDKLIEECMKYYKKPPCKPGDILYVRETWNICSMFIEGNKVTFIYKADESEKKSARTVSVTDAVFDKFGEKMAEDSPEWRPSIHMPKEAARIWLKVTDVRVERLQDISDDDCMKEGIRAWTKDGKLYKYYPADEEGDYPNCAWSECPRTPKEAMEKVWNSTIKKSDLPRYGWDANPWVWVIEFARCENPEDWTVGNKCT